MYPTPYLWDTAEGLSHILYANYQHPSTAFGWSSLCNEVRLPTEGEHFKLIEDVTRENITCSVCREKIGEPYFKLGNDSIASMDGCLVRFDRTKEDVISHAHFVCGGSLLQALSFELDSFTGNLTDQIEDVCTECWEAYVDRQWAENAEGGELHVAVNGEDGHSEYFAVQAIACGGYPDHLTLVSENDLKETVRGDEIEFITMTPGKDIHY